MTSELKELLVDKMVENLPTLRKKLKLSQEGLAEYIGTSRYTVLSIESKKRKMMWSTFLSLILLFDKNKETSALLKSMDIYTKELDHMLKKPSEDYKNK